MKKVLLSIVCFLLFSCTDSRVEQIEKQVKEWTGKEILFPKEVVFTKFGVDTVEYEAFAPSYRIVTYVDSMDCISCKLQLDRWKMIIAELASITSHSVSVLFFIHSKSKRNLRLALERNKFSHPICIDMNNSFYNLNKFPLDLMFQTFLLDSNNKIIAIGNPVYKYKIKELYFNIVTGKEMTLKNAIAQTEVRILQENINFDSFDWRKEQRKEFRIQNTGDVSLVIDEITTSCGCIRVEYNKKPVPSSKDITINVFYKADHPEYFNKTITIYCNTKNSPLQLKVSGNAK